MSRSANKLWDRREVRVIITNYVDKHCGPDRHDDVGDTHRGTHNGRGQMIGLFRRTHPKQHTVRAATCDMCAFEQVNRPATSQLAIPGYPDMRVCQPHYDGWIAWLS